MDILNLMGSRYVSQLPLSEIHDLCRKYSRSRNKVGKEAHGSLTRVMKSTSGGGTRAKIGNLLEYFKSDLLGTISSQLDTLKI